MVKEVQIKDLMFADDSLYKSQIVKIGSKSFRTPIKVMDINRYIHGINMNKSIKGVNEICKKFNSTRITNALTTSREEEINNEINRRLRIYCSDDEVNICFTEFEEDGLPKEEEIEYLTNLSYVHSDITPLPLIPKFFRGIKQDAIKKFEIYHHFIKDTINSINELNNKPIMGIIPMSLPTAFIPQLLDTYINEGITALCLDYQGSTVGSSLTKIRRLVRSINKENVLEKTFIYSLNLGPGKLPKSKEVVPAKDILSFGYGFDAIGGIHVQKKLPPEIRQKILSAQNIFENSLRLFNKEDYGYYRATKKETVDKIYPHDSNIPLNILERIKKEYNVDKLFNQEQQGLEALNLRKVINENHELLKYLDRKEYVEKIDIKNLEKIKRKK